MKRDLLYEKNLRLFAKTNPLEACRLEFTEDENIQFCKTAKDELNLFEEGTLPPFYMHSQSGAQLEAKLWAKNLPLERIDLLIVYGLGLGYYYQAVQDWLQADVRHKLIFIEKKPIIVKKFLQTKLAEEILKSPQVAIKLYSFLNESENVGLKLRAEASAFWPLAFSKPHISALFSYFTKNFAVFNALTVELYALLAHMQRSVEEFLPNPNLIIQNFYANIPALAKACLGEKLYGAFKGFPAIICGAGPSLDKQIPQLKLLADRALLLASGSAATALSRAGIQPHAAGAVDPKLSQVQRQLASEAFELPLFYQNRYSSEALSMWQGPTLFIPGSGSFLLSKWLVKTLGLKELPELIAGVSSSNFLLELAGQLRCNPIILIGMDLAYTSSKNYSQWVVTDPLEKMSTDAASAPKISFPDIYSKNVLTRKSWMIESLCMSAFQMRNPHTLLINATEGGIGIDAVPNLSLAEVSTKFLRHSTDVQGWLHGERENCADASVPFAEIIAALEKWKKSLKYCRANLMKLIAELKNNIKHIKQAKEKSFKATSQSPFNAKASLYLHEIEAEEGYRFLLCMYESIFDVLHGTKKQQISFLPNARMRLLKQSEYELERCQFLHSYLDFHLLSIEQTLYRHKEIKSFRKPLAFALQPVFPIIEREIQTCSEERGLFYYPDGKVKIEAHYKAGVLHGPWTFYGKNGRILSRSIFISGKREGHSLRFYANGALYSMQTYVNNELDGEQRTWFPTGLLKTSAHYSQGKLDNHT